MGALLASAYAGKLRLEPGTVKTALLKRWERLGSLHWCQSGPFALSEDRSCFAQGIAERQRVAPAFLPE
jgi:hypothetical protein